MQEPTFDRDGYPTEETLQAITGWDWHDLPGLMAFIARAWKYPEHAQEVQPGRWVFATMGWSGNESLMGALMRNLFFQFVALNHLSLTGGLWVFALTEPAQRDLRKMEDAIVQWAWGRMPAP